MMKKDEKGIGSCAGIKHVMHTHRTFFTLHYIV